MVRRKRRGFRWSAGDRYGCQPRAGCFADFPLGRLCDRGQHDNAQSLTPGPSPEYGRGEPVVTPGPSPQSAAGIIDVGLGSATIDCEIAGSGLVKTGGGTLVLGALNSYSISTTVSAGVLQLQNGAALPLGTALLVNGGVLDLGGTTTADVTTVTLVGGSIVDGGLQADTAIELYSGTVLADLSGTAGLDKLGPDTVDPRRRQHLSRRHQRFGGHARGHARRQPAGAAPTARGPSSCSRRSIGRATAIGPRANGNWPTARRRPGSTAAASSWPRAPMSISPAW